MTEITKSSWITTGNEVHIGVEFSKNGINKAKRLVSGWATLDNVDTQGDIVTAEASLKAFTRARGNLREMHKKDSAVGRIVKFREDTFTDSDGNTHKGIFVTARVSEGAQDTWLKVLDGTLSGFSIGGSVNAAEEIFNKSGDKIQKVTDYDLTELSLVDNPANPLADVVKVEKNIFTINKDENGIVKSITGMAAETDILNIFWCEEDEIALAKSRDSYACPACNEVMKFVDFIEGGDGTDEKVKNVITKYVNHDEGGVAMKFTSLRKSATVQEPEKADETVETGHDAGDPTEVPTPAKTDEDVVEVKDEDDDEKVVEVHDEDEEIKKMIGGLKSSIEKIMSDSRTETNEKIDKLEKAVENTRNLIDEKISELNVKYSSISEDLETTKSRQSDFEKSLGKINSRSAFKKSVDVDDSMETEPKSDIWRGSAFSVDELVR